MSSFPLAGAHDDHHNPCQDFDRESSPGSLCEAGAEGVLKSLLQAGIDHGLKSQTDRIGVLIQSHTQTLMRRLQELEVKLLSSERLTKTSTQSVDSSYHHVVTEHSEYGSAKHVSERLPAMDEAAVSRGTARLSMSPRSDAHSGFHKFGLKGPNPTRTSSVIGAASSEKFRIGKVWQDELDIVTFDDNVNDEGWYPSRMKQDSIASMAMSGPVHGWRCIIPPSSGQRLVWDMAGLLLIFWDIITLPFFLAFDPPETLLTMVMFWLVLIFWTCDIALSFNTGVYRHGTEVLDRSVAIRVYVSTWMVPDILVVGFDWFGVLLGTQGSGMSGAGRGVRVLKAIRVVRLLRLMKLRRIVDEIQGRLMSEPMNIAMKMGKLTSIVLLLNHIVACLWWSIGKMNDAEGYSGWSKELISQNRNLVYRYTTALHWSLTQFTPASMEVIAGNTAERLFTVVVLIFALLVFSSFLSSITAAMTELRNLRTAADKNVSVLRRFLKSRAIHNNLTMRIMRYVEHKLKQQKHQIQENDVVLLRLLSQPLQNELMKEIYQPTMSRHPFFRCLGKFDDSAMQQVCNSALSVVALSVNDTLFTRFTKGNRMFVVRNGRLRYHPAYSLNNLEASTPLSGLSPIRKVFSRVSRVSSNLALKERFARRRLLLGSMEALDPGDFCTEAALWTASWLHSGTMKASEVTDVLALEASSFADAIGLHHKAFQRSVKYCRLFVAHLNEASDRGHTTDLGREDLQLIEAMVQDAFFSSTSTLAASRPISEQGQRAYGRSLLKASNSNLSSLPPRGATAEFGELENFETWDTTPNTAVVSASLPASMSPSPMTSVTLRDGGVCAAAPPLGSLGSAAQEVLQPSVALQAPPRLICENVSGRVFYWDV